MKSWEQKTKSYNNTQLFNTFPVKSLYKNRLILYNFGNTNSLVEHGVKNRWNKGKENSVGKYLGTGYF